MLHVYVTPQGPLALSCLETLLTHVLCGKRPFKKLIGSIKVSNAHPQEGDARLEVTGGQFFQVTGILDVGCFPLAFSSLRLMAPLRG